MDVDKKPMDNEILEALLDEAGTKGGETLEEMGKTDVATMTRDEWLTFLHSVCDGFITACWEKNGYHLSAVPF